MNPTWQNCLLRAATDYDDHLLEILASKSQERQDLQNLRQRRALNQCRSGVHRIADVITDYGGRSAAGKGRIQCQLE
jgi:hypothetical protein